MTRPFGEDGGMFKHSLLLVLANRLVTCAISWSSALYYGEHVAPAAPITSYMAVSLANVVATTCQVRGKGCTWRKGGGDLPLSLRTSMPLAVPSSSRLSHCRLCII